MAEILIKNASLYGSAEKKNLLLGEKDGKYFISDIIPANKAAVATREIDLGGATLAPGLIDLHVHLRDPGFEYKEDIESGLAAARAGGFYAVCPMPNTNPVTDSAETVGYIIEKAKGHGKVYPIAAITRGLKGETLNDFDSLIEAGARGFSDDGRPVQNCDVMRRAMIECEKRGVTVFSHSEELTLTAGKTVVNETIGKKLGLDGVPASAEVIGIIKDMALAEETGCSLHICHISTALGVQAVREAKARGVRVTAETAPHYITFTEDDLPALGTAGKMNPPLRTALDREAVIAGLCDGTIDCISTDHAPHSAEEKARSLKDAPCGIIGLESSFPASHTALVKSGRMSLDRLIEKMSVNPAKILGIEHEIETGKSACEITVIDETVERVFSEYKIKSKSKCSPFIGKTLCGRARILEDIIKEKINEF